MADLLKLMHDPKRKYSPEAIISQDLNYLIEEIVRCDDAYCHDLRDLIFESIQLVLSYHNPKTMKEIIQCSNEFEQTQHEDEYCTQLYADSFAEINPIVFDMIELKRKELSPDPLIDYDGTLYESQFWFQHSGDIWRRITHGSLKVSIRDECQRVQEAADRCLEDSQKNNDYCVKLYGNSLSCIPGSYCPYLRHNLMTCMHNRNIKEYQQMRECAESLPNFAACQAQYVEPPAPKQNMYRAEELNQQLFDEVNERMLSTANSV